MMIFDSCLLGTISSDVSISVVPGEESPEARGNGGRSRVPGSGVRGRGSGERETHKPGAVEPDPIRGLIEVAVDGQSTVVEYEPDTNLRDTEQVPLLNEGGIEAFIHREVLPYTPDAWYGSRQRQDWLRDQLYPALQQAAAVAPPGGDTG